MYVTHTIMMDLSGPAVVAKVDMVQRDQYVRKLKLELTSDGAPWAVPESAHAIICYQKADGTGGEYDTLPDGRRAYTAEENVLTVEIAPQVLTNAGVVHMAVDLLLGDAKLSTFRMLLQVQKAIPLGLPSGDYFRMEGFLRTPENGEVGQLLRISGVSEAGQITGLEGYDLSDALEEAKESGLFNGKSAYEVALDNGFEGTEAEWLESLKGKGISPALGNIAQINITGQLTTDYNVIVDFNGSRLMRVKDPVEDTDGVNKAYVDALLGQTGAQSYPEYWQQPLADAQSRVTDLQDLGGREAVSFLWFSDLHLGAEESTGFGAVTTEIMRRCHIPFAVFSGDAIDGGSTTEGTWREAVSNAEMALSGISSGSLLMSQGINDGSRGTDNYISIERRKVYGALFRKQEDGVKQFGPDGTYFYLDHVPSKLRLVVLNCCHRQSGRTSFGFGNAQINWLAGHALVLPDDGWCLAFFCHIPPGDGRIGDAGALLDVLTAFENGTAFSVTSGTEGQGDYVFAEGDFTGRATGDILGFFCGSTGEDTMEISDRGIRTVTIREAIDRGSAAAGTANQYAMDVVTLEPGTKNVSLTRLGAGSNRSFYY